MRAGTAGLRADASSARDPAAALQRPAQTGFGSSRLLCCRMSAAELPGGSDVVHKHASARPHLDPWGLGDRPVSARASLCSVSRSRWPSSGSNATRRPLHAHTHFCGRHAPLSGLRLRGALLQPSASRSLPCPSTSILDAASRLARRTVRCPRRSCLQPFSRAHLSVAQNRMLLPMAMAHTLLGEPSSGTLSTGMPASTPSVRTCTVPATTAQLSAAAWRAI